MNNIHHRLIPENRSPFLIFLMLLASLAAGFFIAAFFADSVAALFLGETNALQKAMQNPSESVWWPVMTAQMVTAVTLFIVTPYIFVKYILKTDIAVLFRNQSHFLNGALITFFVTVSFMFLNVLLIRWNSQLVLPDFLSDVESYIREKEDSLAELTTFLTNFSSFDKYLFTLVVIALVPAIGEELLFRGLIQTLFAKYVKNIHVAILITAILFSAFHIQFYGFLPRAALGVLFGYLFYYSGNLLYAMIAHFVNNALTITMVYLYHINQTDINIESQEQPPILLIAFFTIMGILLMFTFYRLFYKVKIANG